MKEYTVSPDHISQVRSLAVKIQASKDYTRNWKLDNIIVGLLGEQAYSSLIGVPINSEVWSNMSDIGYDFSDGANVKTTTYTGPDPELKISKIPNFTRVKKYVLAVCDYRRDPSKVYLIGEISVEGFKIKCTQRTCPDGRHWFAVRVPDLETIYS